MPGFFQRHRFGIGVALLVAAILVTFLVSRGGDFGHLLALLQY